MSTVPNRPNVKLAKLLYKYADESKERKEHEEGKKENQSVKEEQTKEEEQTKTYESYPPYNFSWVLPKQIAGMGWPQTVGNLNYLVDVGVNHLITLSPERLPPILECEKKLKWTEIGIEEFCAPTLKQIIKFIEICERAILRGEVIGVHCRQGYGRTGTMLACYLVYFKHMTPERALITIRMQRPGSCETYEQERIICHYHDCLRGTVTYPDYNMVDSKLYFDFSMKHMFGDDEDKKKQKDGNHSGTQDGTHSSTQNDVQDGDKQVTDETEPETLQLSKKKKKSEAMVINHKIYF